MLGSTTSPDKPQDSSVENEFSNPAVSKWLSSVGKIDTNNNSLPDVYYIVLDGYARGDVLASRFGFDNSDFLDWLEKNGFFVGHQSHANYPWTALSLSATFNLEYLQTLLPEGLRSSAPDEIRTRFQFFSSILSKDYIKSSRIRHFFSSIGYRIISNITSYAVTRIESASLSNAMLNPMNEFEETLIGNSIIEPFILAFRSEKGTRQLAMTKYDQIVNSLEDLADIADENGPKFVFYHIESPHHPLCFDEKGEMVPRHPVFEASPWMLDRRAIPGYFAWSRENFPKNVAGLNVHVKRAIKQILDEAEGNAIVIIQSDHGSSYGIDPDSVAKTDVVERFGVLNAVFFPDRFPRTGLDEDMSLVNTFRFVLRNAFNVNLPALENRAYYSNGDLDFKEVTHRLQVPANAN